MTTKTRTPKTTKPATVDPAPEATAKPAPEAAQPATSNAGSRYMLAKAARPGLTLQRPAKGLGRGWRAPGHKAPSLRHNALAALAAVAEEDEAGALFITYEQALKVFKALHDEGLLGSGTPRSYWTAFVAEGHLVAC